MAEQLSKEDEETAGDEIEVRREDQDKINKFSRLHQHELSIEEDLKAKNVSVAPALRRPLASLLTSAKKEKEELDDITAELELADDDDIIP